MLLLVWYLKISFALIFFFRYNPYCDYFVYHNRMTSVSVGFNDSFLVNCLSVSYILKKLSIYVDELKFVYFLNIWSPRHLFILHISCTPNPCTDCSSDIIARIPMIYLFIFHKTILCNGLQVVHLPMNSFIILSCNDLLNLCLGMKNMKMIMYHVDLLIENKLFH